MPRIASTSPEDSGSEESDASSSSSARVQGPPRRSASNLANARIGAAAARLPAARKSRSRPSRGGGGSRRRGGPGPPPKRKDNMGETVMKLMPVDSRDGSVDTEGLSGEHVEKRWVETKEFRGQTYIVEDDELTLPSDEKGDAKVDANGVLLGGREYKMPTFTSKTRSNPNKHYMLAIDAARSAGFRDSLYFFRRHPLILRLTCTQAEKDTLINAGCLHNNLRSRPVTICCARNAYKVVGARFLLNGKHVVDDYYEDEAVAAGRVAGEPAIPEAILAEQEKAAAAAAAVALDSEFPSRGISPPPSQALLPDPSGPTTAFRNSLRTRFPVQPPPIRNVYGGDGRPPYGEKGWDVSEKKRKPASNLTPINWMTEYARATSEMNRYLRGMRRQRLQPLDLGFMQEREGEEWEDVEVDVPIDLKGRIIHSDDEDQLVSEEEAPAVSDQEDAEEEEEDEDDADDGEEEGDTTSVLPTAEPSTQVSRATSSIPVDASGVQIHGGEKARYILDGAGLFSLAPNPNASMIPPPKEEGLSPMPSTLLPPGAVETGDAAGDDGLSRSKSPVKTASKRKLEARWTTTIKERQLVEKGPPKVLWDPYTGGAIVKKDLQSNRVEFVKVSSTPWFSDEATRHNSDADLGTGPETANGDEGGETLTDNKKRKLFDASRAGIATVEVVVRDLPYPPRALPPTIWDFGAPR